jgi:GUN4-like
MSNSMLYLPHRIESLIDILIGTVKDKVDNATTTDINKVVVAIQKEFTGLNDQNKIENIHFIQRHKLQMKLLSLLEKIDIVRLSSHQELIAFQQLIKIALALTNDNYLQTLEKITINGTIFSLSSIHLPSEQSPKFYLLNPTRFDDSTKQLISELRGDYSQLEELLASGKWRDADRETREQMLQVAERNQLLYLTLEDIDRFPLVDLRMIDELWVKYSDGRFGFSVQKRIYHNLGGTRNYQAKIWEDFSDKVGWRINGQWLSYSELNFDSKARIGHLPAMFGGRVFGGDEDWFWFGEGFGSWPGVTILSRGIARGWSLFSREDL